MEAILLIDIYDDDDETILVHSGTRFEYESDCMEQCINGIFYYLDFDEFQIEEE